MNPALELYGEERLTAQLAKLQKRDARAICDGLSEDVHAFAAGAEQSDDITLLVLRFNGVATGGAAGGATGGAGPDET